MTAKHALPRPVSHEAPAPTLLPWRVHETHCTAIVESSADAIISIDHGTVSEWNPAAAAMFGYTRALAIGRDAGEFIAAGPDTDEPRADFLHTLKSGKGRLIGKRTELTAMRANGGSFPIELTLTLAPDHEPPAFTACIRDITEQKRAESDLRQSEERFRLLVESAEDFTIYLLNPGGRILTWNAGSERLDGYRARDIIGRRFSRLYTPEDIARGVPAQALATAELEGRHYHEGWSVRKDGSLYWASVVLAALRDDHGGLLAFSRIGRDRTVRRDTEVEAHRLATQLEAHLRERTAELQAVKTLLREAQA